MRYEIVRRGLIWRWAVLFGPEGWAFTKATAKKRAIAAIAKLGGAVNHSVERSTK